MKWLNIFIISIISWQFTFSLPTNSLPFISQVSAQTSPPPAPLSCHDRYPSNKDFEDFCLCGMLGGEQNITVDMVVKNSSCLKEKCDSKSLPDQQKCRKNLVTFITSSSKGLSQMSNYMEGEKDQKYASYMGLTMAAINFLLWLAYDYYITGVKSPCGAKSHWLMVMGVLNNLVANITGFMQEIIKSAIIYGDAKYYFTYKDDTPSDSQYAAFDFLISEKELVREMLILRLSFGAIGIMIYTAAIYFAYKELILEKQGFLIDPSSPGAPPESTSSTFTEVVMDEKISPKGNEAVKETPAEKEARGAKNMAIYCNPVPASWKKNQFLNNGTNANRRVIMRKSLAVIRGLITLSAAANVTNTAAGGPKMGKSGVTTGQMAISAAFAFLIIFNLFQAGPAKVNAPTKSRDELGTLGKMMISPATRLLASFTLLSLTTAMQALFSRSLYHLEGDIKDLETIRDSFKSSQSPSHTRLPLYSHSHWKKIITLAQQVFNYLFATPLALALENSPATESEKLCFSKDSERMIDLGCECLKKKNCLQYSPSDFSSLPHSESWKRSFAFVNRMTQGEDVSQELTQQNADLMKDVKVAWDIQHKMFEKMGKLQRKVEEQSWKLVTDELKQSDYNQIKFFSQSLSAQPFLPFFIDEEKIEKGKKYSHLLEKINEVEKDESSNHKNLDPDFMAEKSLSPSDKESGLSHTKDRSYQFKSIHQEAKQLIWDLISHRYKQHNF